MKTLAAFAFVAFLAAGCGGGSSAKSSITLPPLPTTATGATTTKSASATTSRPTATTSAASSATTAKSGSPTTTTAASTSRANPCQLVGKADAEALAGTSLQDGALVTGDSAACTYSGSPDGPTAQVEVYLGDGAKNILDVDRTLQHDFTTLNGIGDEAYLEQFNVFVRKGTIWVAIRVVRLDDPEPYNQRLTNLATKVAGQL